jgi:IS5 family transposase
MVEGNGIPLDRVLAPANRHDSMLLARTLDKLDEIGPLPDGITVHLDAGYDPKKTRDELGSRGMATSARKRSSTRSSTSSTRSSPSVA